MQAHQGYGFTEFLTEEDAEYACKIMNQVKLFGKPIRVNKASSDKKQTPDIGAEIFVGNLDPTVDEKMLYDTFSSFGILVKPPVIQRGADGQSKGFGFVNYDNFDSADAAVGAMNNQFLMNKSVSVGFAYKQSGKGERHGDAAERLLASQAKKNNVSLSPAPLLGMGMGMGMGMGLPGGPGMPPAVPQGFAGGYGLVAQQGGLPPPPPVAPGGFAYR